MQIPHAAIQKAIAGGWTLGEHYPGEVGDAQSLWQLLALDSEFWIALSKALGWPESRLAWKGWQNTAQTFYDLIRAKAAELS